MPNVDNIASRRASICLDASNSVWIEEFVKFASHAQGERSGKATGNAVDVDVAAYAGIDGNDEDDDDDKEEDDDGKEKGVLTVEKVLEMDERWKRNERAVEREML